MRKNSLGQIARDHNGAALAHWIDEHTELIHQPVNLSNPAGPWHLVTRRSGVVTTYADTHPWSVGANFYAARSGAWIRQFDAQAERIKGSADWLKAHGHGRVGDVDYDASILVISDDGLTMYVNGKAIPRTEVQGYTRLLDGLLSWTASGQVKVFDVRADRLLPVSQVGPGAAKALAWRVGGEVWVSYQTDEHAGVLHRISDASQGYRFGQPKQVYEQEFHFTGNAGNSGELHWSIDEGQLHQPPPVVVAEFGVGMVALAPVVLPVRPNVPTFAFCGTWFAADDVPGNLAIGSPTYTKPRHTAVLADINNIDSIPPERLAGLLIYHLDDDDLKATEKVTRHLTKAASCGVPLFVYDDREIGRFELVEQACGLAPWVWMPQWYLNMGESPAAFAAGVKALAASYGGHPILPVIRAYTSVNDQKVDMVPEASVVAGLNELVRQDALKIPGFLGPMFFAFDRADGAKHRPAIRAALTLWASVPTTVTDARAWAQAFCASAQPPTPFGIRVDAYTTEGIAPVTVSAQYEVEGAPGAVTVMLTLDGRVVASSNQAVGTIESSPLVQAGEYRIGLIASSLGRKTETQKVRIVRVLPSPEIPGITYPTQPGSGTVEGARSAIQEAADAAKREEKQ